MPNKEPTNRDRARRATTAVETHASLMGGNPDKEQPDTKIVDLIADLMHLADQHALDWNSLYGTALHHHEAEIHGRRRRCPHVQRN